MNRSLFVQRITLSSSIAPILLNNVISSSRESETGEVSREIVVSEISHTRLSYSFSNVSISSEGWYPTMNAVVNSIE